MTRATQVPRSPEPGPPEQVTRFDALSVAWDARVLEPRLWTAAQSWWAADLLCDAPPGAVLELFAGVGHIGQLAVRGSMRHLVCVDLSPVACEHARRNAARHDMSERVEVRCAPIATALEPGESFAMVIADPPWVPTARVREFPEDPRVAIDGGRDGLDLARESLGLAARCLAPGGSVLLQLGSVEQAEALRGPATDHDLHLEEVRPFERGTIARLIRGCHPAGG